MPPVMKLRVDATMLGGSRFEMPKMPWPLVQPSASRVPNADEQPAGEHPGQLSGVSETDA